MVKKAKPLSEVRSHLDEKLQASTPEHTVTLKWASKLTWRAFCSCGWISNHGTKSFAGLVGVHHINVPDRDRTAW